MKVSINPRVVWCSLMALLLLTAGLGVTPAHSEGVSTVTFYVY
jgi:hypothetical protein